MSLVVGLTGGIGSGKSTVADNFAALGATVVDTDVIAHELTGPQGAAMPAIAAEFGPAVVAPDGRLDRAAMRALVFSDPAVRDRLEAILHPRIRAESRQRVREALAGGAPYVLLVVPLLVESGAYRDRVDRILVVDCDDDLRVARVRERSGLSEPEIRAIMATQASRAARLAVADEVILNNSGKCALEAEVARLHRFYRDLSSRDDATAKVNEKC